MSIDPKFVELTPDVVTTIKKKMYRQKNLLLMFVRGVTATAHRLAASAPNCAAAEHSELAHPRHL